MLLRISLYGWMIALVAQCLYSAAYSHKEPRYQPVEFRMNIWVLRAIMLVFMVPTVIFTCYHHKVTLAVTVFIANFLIPEIVKRVAFYLQAVKYANDYFLKNPLLQDEQISRKQAIMWARQALTTEVEMGKRPG